MWWAKQTARQQYNNNTTTTAHTVSTRRKRRNERKRKENDRISYAFEELTQRTLTSDCRRCDPHTIVDILSKNEWKHLNTNPSKWTTQYVHAFQTYSHWKRTNAFVLFHQYTRTHSKGKNTHTHTTMHQPLATQSRTRRITINFHWCLVYTFFSIRFFLPLLREWCCPLHTYTKSFGHRMCCARQMRHTFIFSLHSITTEQDERASTANYGKRWREQEKNKNMRHTTVAATHTSRGTREQKKKRKESAR